MEVFKGREHGFPHKIAGDRFRARKTELASPNFRRAGMDTCLATRWQENVRERGHSCGFVSCAKTPCRSLTETTGDLKSGPPARPGAGNSGAMATVRDTGTCLPRSASARCIAFSEAGNGAPLPVTALRTSGQSSVMRDRPVTSLGD
ncbi:hypothetical protein MRX96_008266 [Rhipicephalus microplus]